MVFEISAPRLIQSKLMLRTHLRSVQPALSSDHVHNLETGQARSLQSTLAAAAASHCSGKAQREDGSTKQGFGNPGKRMILKELVVDRGRSLEGVSSRARA